MYELREYENGSLSLVFDLDFEFNVFRNYIEKKYFSKIEVFLLKKDINDQNKELFIVLGYQDKKSKEIQLIDEFTIKKIQKEIYEELRFTIDFEKDLTITIDNYQVFTNYLILYYFRNIDCEWEEEEIEIDGIVEIQNIVYCKKLPDEIIEVMDLFYEK